MSSLRTLTISVVAKTEMYVVTSACIAQAMDDLRYQNLNVIQSLCVGQSDLPKARSCQMTMWFDRAKERDIFMFIDADQVFKTEDILKSVSLIDKYDIVCGAYPRKSGDMTVEPVNMRTFIREKEGPLIYGATGFMMTSYESASKLVKYFGKKVRSSRQDMTYPFFFERIVEEKGETDLWLGEDYSFCWLMRQLGGKVHGYISPSLGHILTFERFVQLPTEIKWPEKSIVVHCAMTAEAWSAESLDRGIGGSETAVIQLAKIWTTLGYKVFVYCTCDKPGEYDGVTYERLDKFSVTDIFDIFIVWRQPTLLDTYPIEARKIFVDLHDLVAENTITKSISNAAYKICVKSNFQKSLLGPNVPESKIAVIPNGGYKEYKNTEKDRNYIIYSSSYDRGLLPMLTWGWPMIKRECPDAYMKIFYGWDCFDACRPKTAEVEAFKFMMKQAMTQPGIQHMGRVPVNELMAEKAKANIHYYVGGFQEIDCISVRESASMKVIPIVSEEVKVFAEKPYCIRVSGNPDTKETQEKAADLIIRMLKCEEYAETIRKELTVPSSESWSCVAKEWAKFFN